MKVISDKDLNVYYNHDIDMNIKCVSTIPFIFEDSCITLLICYLEKAKKQFPLIEWEIVEIEIKRKIK